MNQAASDDYVQLMTTNQSRLYAYILSLVGRTTFADDILQETNLVLWRKAGDFTLGTNFSAWMFRIAHFQVLAYLQRVNREKVLFDSTQVPELANEVSDHLDGFDARRQALRACLEKLSPRQRDALRRRYLPDANLDQIASELGNTVAAVKQILFRSREALASCIRQRLGAGSLQ